jgi:hypothetical protein
MASLLPRLLPRRRLNLQPAAAAALRSLWFVASPPHNGPITISSPRLGALLERSRGSAGFATAARRRSPGRHGSTEVTLDTDGGFARFSVGDHPDIGRQQQPPAAAGKKKMSKKSKVNQLKWFRLKAKKKMKSPNPEVRIRYKLDKVSPSSSTFFSLIAEKCCIVNLVFSIWI